MSKKANKQHEINFICNSTEDKLIRAIVKRAIKLTKLKIWASTLDCFMDIAATHLNGNPLKLRELLKADDFNFAHDVFGIARHLNRETGKLENLFLPRYSA